MRAALNESTIDKRWSEGEEKGGRRELFASDAPARTYLLSLVT